MKFLLWMGPAMIMAFPLAIFCFTRRTAKAQAKTGAERRRAPRVPIRVKAEIQASDGRLIHGATRDLSVRGMFFLSGQIIPAQTECRVVLLLGDEGRVRLKLNGRVAHASPTGLGVEFTAMSRECYENLHYLVDYNTYTQDSVHTTVAELSGPD